MESTSSARELGGRRADRGAVATPHWLATAAATGALDAGGNALDAALAAASMLVVVYPHACSLGGDLIAMVVDPSGQINVINSTGATNGHGEIALPPGSSMPERGPIPITVPGVVAGWQAIADLGCRLSLHERLERAATIAFDGCLVSTSVGRAIRDTADAVSSDPGLSSILMRDGRLIDSSDTLVQPALGRTLADLADTGLMDFYEGSIAKRIASALGTFGSSITAADLEAHQVEKESPLSASFFDWSVFAPGPNSQGFALLAMLVAVEALNLDLVGQGAGLAAEVFRLVSEERDARLADPRFSDVDIDEFLRPNGIRDLLRSGRREGLAIEPLGDRKGDTVAVVAADNEGWVVSLIQSVFSSFGSGMLDPSTGILFHNRGYGFSLDPSSPNCWRQAKRPAHTLTPVIARSRSGELLSLGSMGALATPQILTHVLTRVASGQTLMGALDAPRWVVGGMQAPVYEEIYAESRVSQAALDDFTARGFRRIHLPDRDEDVGQANAVLAENGRLSAMADPRSDG